VAQIEAIQNTPDISFIDNKTIKDVQEAMIADYEAFMTAAEGKEVTLERTSVHRMIINAAAAQIYQALQYIDRAGKQNLLKYSYSEFLDNLALFKGVTRLPAAAAVTTLRFTLSAVRNVATAIPKGTRASTAEGVYFATDKYAEIPIGSLYVDVPATCTVVGKDANGIAIGDIHALVDPIPYVKSVSNTVVTGGGADIESDDALAKRVYLAPSAYSTAGPEDSYKYHAQKYNSAIGDVVATSNHEAGEVNIVFLMSDGTVPDETTINGLEAYLNDDTIRPMTDVVTVAAPTAVDYTIDLTYYINRSDGAKAVTIQSAIEQAVMDYVTWQRHIGKDINPSKLVALIMAAGAKRVEVTAPVHTVVDSTSVPNLSGTPSVNYGGLEDD
jgi:phage-related baseplate assembly protein